MAGGDLFASSLLQLYLTVVAGQTSAKLTVGKWIGDDTQPMTFTSKLKQEAQSHCDALYHGDTEKIDRTNNKSVSQKEAIDDKEIWKQNLPEEFKPIALENYDHEMDKTGILDGPSHILAYQDPILRNKKGDFST